MKILNLISTCSLLFILSFALAQNESTSTRRPEIQTTPTVLQHDIISLQHTYIPPHIKGDKDFEGRCDLSSTATLKISDDQTKLYIQLYFKAMESHPDSTEASGTETFIIYDTKDSNKKIVKILSGTMDRGSFISENASNHLRFEPYTLYASWDLINGIPGGGGEALRLIQRASDDFTNDFSRNGLVKKWVFFVGEAHNKAEAGSQTKVTIETNTISILVKEN